MADPNQVLTPEPAGAEAGYRPISGLAIAGLALAGIYALVISVSTVAGLIQGSGFFLPNELLLLPIGGALLCFLAQRQIRASEGTRAGLTVARWGLWLSLFTGLGYYSYYYFTYLAIRGQANAFLMEKDTDSGFFPLLQEGGPAQVNAAFLLTIPEFSRGPAKPDNLQQMTRLFDLPGRQGPGLLTSFRNNYLVQALVRGGKECTIEPQGVHDWRFEKGGYKVIRIYRIMTPEAIFKAVVPVHSTADELGGMRKWYVIFPLVNFRVDDTPLGKSLKNIHALARVFLENKWNDLLQGKSVEPFPDKTKWEKVPPELGKLVREVIKGKETRFSVELGKVDLSPWRLEKGKVQFDFVGSLQFPGPQEMPMAAEMKITVECQEPVAPEGDDRPDLSRFPEQPHWTITAFEITGMAPMGPRK
jgi:hypothetical protein